MSTTSVTIYRIRQRTGWTGTSIISNSGVEYAINDAVNWAKAVSGESLTSGSPGNYVGPITDYTAYLCAHKVSSRVAQALFSSDIVNYSLGRLRIEKNMKVLSDLANEWLASAKEGMEIVTRDVEFVRVSGVDKIIRSGHY